MNRQPITFAVIPPAAAAIISSSAHAQEATASDSGVSQWRVACARFSNWPMRVSLGDREFWSCAKAEPFQVRGPYYLWFAVERRPASPAESNAARERQPVNK